MWNGTQGVHGNVMNTMHAMERSKHNSVNTMLLL